MLQGPERDTPTLRLHDFLRDESESILSDWSRANREAIASARGLSNEELRNNVPNILHAIARQSGQAASEGRKPNMDENTEGGAQHHAVHRWRLGFSLQELTHEYALLRSMILQKLVPRVGELPTGELAFLNEALDQAIIEGVVTYMANANRALAEEQERLRVTLSSICDGVVSTDPDGRVVYMNPAAEQILGWTQHEARELPIDEVLVSIDETTRQRLQSLTQVVTETGKLARHPAEVLLRRRDGDLMPAEETAAPLRDSEGRFLGVVITFRDVSKVRALTSQLGYLATHDRLTGLPNRALLADRLAQELAHAERNSSRIALLYLDLDLFKDVNDMLGHSAGDQLLRYVAQRLQACVRRTDTVSRLGGDEFAILVTEVGSLAYLNELSSSITGRLSSPYAIRTDTVDISTSVGISVFPEDGRDPETLIKHADTAMYQAKSLGRNNVQFFTPAMNRQAAERRKLQGELRKALAAGELSVVFQPQVALESGRLVGAETLLRWRHPQLGLVPPDRFIPVAESSREVMTAIGNWVLEEACRQARHWLEAGHAPLRVSVNMSIVQLQCETLLDHVSEVLRRFHLPPDQLQLELTESVLMSDIAGAADRVRGLEDLGVRIAVDDFGTGYSSLSYLKDLPVDELKIDRSFVSNIGTDADKAAIVRAVIRLGQSLNLRVIAEGVENEETVDFLAANDCDGAQGYYYSGPVNAAEFERRFLDPARKPGR